MECKIVIPSRGRHENLFTNVDNAILCVAENEYDNYKNNQYNYEVITHPNLTKLSLIRQFIYEKYNDVFMLDDDLVSCERLYTTKNAVLSSAEAYELIQNTYIKAKSIGAKVFGFNNDANPTHYNQHKPFMLIGYINASAFGIMKDDNLYFNKDTTACESHWINLLNYYHNRFSFIDKRFHFRQKNDSTFKLLGGQTGKEQWRVKSKILYY